MHGGLDAHDARWGRAIAVMATLVALLAIAVGAHAAETGSAGVRLLMYSHSPDCGGDGLIVNGTSMGSNGAIRSNGRLGLNGNELQLGSVSGFGPNGCVPEGDPQYTQQVTQDNALVPWPVYYSFPGDGDGAGGDPTTPFPASYCNFTADKFEFSGGQEIADGVYCARTEFKVSGDNHNARITVLAPVISVSGNNNSFTSFDTARQLLFFSTGTDPAKNTDTPPCDPNDKYELVVNGDGMTIEGLLFNPCGSVKVNGRAASVLRGFLVGMTVQVNGDNFHLEGTGPVVGGPDGSGVAGQSNPPATAPAVAGPSAVAAPSTLSSSLGGGECALKPFRAYVTKRGVRSVTFLLNGRRHKTVRRADRHGQFSALIDTKGLATNAQHRLAAYVRFRNTKRKPRLVALRFRRCSYKCASRRGFRVRIPKVRGEQVISATVYVNGRRVAVRRGRRLTAPVQLTGLPKGTYTVRITSRTRSARTVTSARRYRTCTVRQQSGRKKGAARRN